MRFTSCFLILAFAPALFFSCQEKSNDPTVFQEVIAEAKRGEFGELESLIVSRQGEILIEEYFNDSHENKLLPIYSITKSISSLLVGIALSQNENASIDQNLLDLLSEYDDIKNLDEDKSSIILKDVLTMRAGLEWDELTYHYEDPRNSVYQLIVGNDDYVKAILDLPMKSKPNAEFNYNSGLSILLATIIENISDQSLDQFANKHLFSLLDIQEYNWERLPNGTPNTGWGLSMKPIDLLKIGEMVLQKGQWQGREILSPSWISESTSSDSFYGYQWWIGTDYFYAHGYGGQFILINPQLDLIVVVNASNYDVNGDDAGIQLFERIVSALT